MDPNEKETYRIGLILNTDCSCHLSPPCNRCENLAEDEIDLTEKELRRVLMAKLDDMENGL